MNEHIKEIEQIDAFILGWFTAHSDTSKTMAFCEIMGYDLNEVDKLIKKAMSKMIEFSMRRKSS